MKRLFFSFIFILILFSNFISIGEENKDVILLVDVSNSMKRVFADVQDYFIDELIGKKINVGDNLFIILFYGKTRTAYNKKIENENDLNNVKKVVEELTATGPWTDIGNALDVLKVEISKRIDLNKDKYVLLLTDGYQEAPPESKYFSRDGTISHKLLENAQTFDRKGWKIQVLSIGGRKEMKKIAEELGAEYTEVSEKPDKTELTKKTEDLFKKIEFVPIEDLGFIHRYQGKIKGDVLSSYNRKIFLDISRIVFDNITSISKNLEQEIVTDNAVINDKGFSFLINENEKKKIQIPVRLKEKFKPGKYSARLKFYFNSTEQFSPTSFAVKFTYPNFIIRNLYLILLILLILLLLLIFLIKKYGNIISGKASGILKIKGKLKYEFIDQIFRTSRNILFRKNEKKMIGGSKSQISIPRIGFIDNIAQVSYDKYGFHLDILRQQYFRTKLDRDHFLNKEIEIKSTTGKTYYIKFNKI